jgi:hypothetical protein
MCKATAGHEVSLNVPLKYRNIVEVEIGRQLKRRRVVV